MLTAVTFALSLAVAPQAPVELPPIPRLVVVVSIDQFRADYVLRYSNHFLPASEGSKVGGFKFLMERGANYVDAHYQHLPTYTGAGHAVITTGSIPSLNGIVGNEWFDRSTLKEMYCVTDASVKTVGGPSGPMSPKNLVVTTVGDELKMATNGKAKVVGISFKDRAAILLAGHAADSVVWFDSSNGKWVTSTFYAPDGKLPAWVETLNSQNVPAAAVGKVWTPALPDTAYALTRPAPFVSGEPTTPVFSHRIANNGDFTTSDAGQEYVFDTVKQAVSSERLGQDEVPDVLCVNLATNDYVGHRYGPNSPEAMDITVRTDRLLSGLFNSLNLLVQGGLENVTIVVTADHGVAPIPEEANKAFRIGSAQRGSASGLRAAIEAAMKARYGAGDYVQYCDLPYVYINRALIKEKQLDLAQAQRTAAEAARAFPNVQEAFAGEDVLANRIAPWPWIQEVTNGYNRNLSGDVVVLENPNTIFAGGNGTTHGSAWSYDTHVPILFYGAGVTPGTKKQRVTISDIAPTLSFLLRIEQPSGSVGKILPD